MKALLFDETGKVAGQSKKPTPLSMLETGGGIFHADEIWRVCCALIADLIHAQEAQGNLGIRNMVAGIAITGMGEAGVPMDAAGNVLYPAIAWFDPRTEKYPSWWNETFGDEKLFEITNLRNQHIFTIHKLLWLKEYEPSIFAKMKRWNCMPDFIAYKLTGHSAMDYSIATRTMMLDARTKTWSEEILRHAGIPGEILPEPVPSGTRIGEVSAAAETLCGLKAGTPVFAGGHDHICGALAAGIISPGVVLDSSGTCEEVLISVENQRETISLSRAGFNAGFHTAAEQYYISGGIPASGTSVDWFRREFPTSSDSSTTSEAGARGLLFLPHLRGSSSPQRDKISKGAFIGIQAHHHREDFIQAVYEGVAFELRLSIEQLLNGKTPDRVVSIGGGTMNTQWLQVKANILNVEIEVPEVQECTALGAALLAGIGAGIYKNAKDAVNQTFRVGQKVIPQGGTTAIYDRLYKIYRSLYGTLRPVNLALDF